MHPSATKWKAMGALILEQEYHYPHVKPQATQTGMGLLSPVR